MSTNKEFYTYDQINALTDNIIAQLEKDNWKPDYIVGLTRGGLIPAVTISHKLNIPMETLRVSLRDHEDYESNCWMAEDAFNGDNILIVDDINDSGATLDWIIKDWQSGCHPSSSKWDDIWENNVRFAVLFDNHSSDFGYKVNYFGTEINKAEKDVWIVFPWEKQ